MLNGVRYSHKRVIKYKDNSLVQAAAAATAAIGPDGTATTANTTAAAAAAAASVGNGNRVCIVCRKATAPYLCPKCNTPYCCVKCYESHGPRCTEAFYKGHVKREQELRASREGDRMLRRGKERKDSNTPATSGSSMPLCLQWGLDDRVRAKVLQQYSAYG